MAFRLNTPFHAIVTTALPFLFILCVINRFFDWTEKDKIGSCSICPILSFLLHERFYKTLLNTVSESGSIVEEEESRLLFFALNIENGADIFVSHF